MLIRKAKVDDAKHCFELFTSDKEQYWEVEDFEKSATNDDVIFFVAERDSKIIGYIIGFIVPTKRAEATIHETRVHESERQKGIGTKLVDAFCEEAFKMGAKIVLIEIAPEDLKFYGDACGFKEVNKWIEVAKKKD